VKEGVYPTPGCFHIRVRNPQNLMEISQNQKLRRVCKLLILKEGIFSGSLKSAQGIENKEVNSECGVVAGGSKGKMVSHLTPDVIHTGSIR